MLRIIVDSGSSIKQEKKEKYGVDILPIRVQIAGKNYLDGIDINIDEFYEKLSEDGHFPKTALPSLEDAKELVESYTNAEDEVLIITISSEISGTYQALKVLLRIMQKSQYLIREWLSEESDFWLKRHISMKRNQEM